MIVANDVELVAQSGEEVIARKKMKHVQPSEVRKKVNHILSDPTFKINCRHISEKLKKYGGATYAACLIEDFAENLSRSNVHASGPKIKRFRSLRLSNKQVKNE